MRNRVFCGILLWSCGFSAQVLATPEEEAQLVRLDQINHDLELQREWAKYRWGTAVTECYQHYFVGHCLSNARARYRQEIDPIQEQEVALHADQRTLRASLKDQDDAKRAADRASPEKAAERAKNQSDYEQKQKDAAARAADLEQRRKDAPKRSQENKAGTQLD